MSLQTAATIREARLAILPWREKGETVAFVPTMGALHKGHLSLVERARKIAKRVVVSIFVNPMQFGPNEDLGKYPRQLEADKALLIEAGCDLVYTPTVAEMYPDGFVSAIDPGPLATVLEGKFRPGHFAGVATVVIKLLLQLMPDAALFGEKDYQQLLVLRRVAKDLDLPIHIISVPILRDDDGLALSSRNAYLSAEDRARALALPRALQNAVTALRSGKNAEVVLQEVKAQIIAAGLSVDYIELADMLTFAPVRDRKIPARLLAAVRVGTTRLIDNVAVV